MLFKILKDKEVVFYTEHESCVPSESLQKQMKKDGYKIIMEANNGSRNSKKTAKKSES